MLYYEQQERRGHNSKTNVFKEDEMKKGKVIIAGIMGMATALTAFGSNTVWAAADGETVKLKVLCCMDPATDGQYKLDAFQETAEALGYEVDVERSDDDTYKTKIRVALQGNELPDIYYTWGGTYSQPFIKAEAMYPLEDAIAESGYDYYDTYMQSDDGHVYALPITAFQAYGMFYNKTLLEEMNLEVPATWDELLEFVDVCNENDVAAIALGNKERWEGDLLYNSLVMLEDTEAFKKAMAGEMSFTDEPFVDAAEKVLTLVERGAFQNGYMQHTDSEVLEVLKADQAATYWIGPWMLSVMAGEDFSGKMGYTTLPRISDDVDPAVTSCTNATDEGFAVSANSENKEAAAKFVVEYTKRVNDYSVAEGAVPIMNSPDAETPDDIAEVNKAYMEQMEALENTQLWWFSSVDSKVGEPMRDLSQQLFAGQISAEGFAEQLESIMRQ